MIWYDPVVPRIRIPADLKTKTFHLGSASFQLLPKQYEFLKAQEQFIGYVSGYGGGKTRVGTIKAAYLSMVPHNRGLVGMEASTDLDAAAERDLLDFLREANLLKEEPTSKNRRAIVTCIDPVTFKPLGATSEISFVHLDDPKHVRGRHLGWFWIDEGSKVKREAWQNLIGRLRLPSFRGRYSAYVTGNPEGHNWIYDFFFNQEILETMTCADPHCQLTNAECNRRMRLKRRAIHCTSFDNYFLPKDYLENMVSSFTEEERKRYLEGSFDIFEGQVFKEFSYETHVINNPWPNARPPREWKRLLACDVGGASPWAFLWAAVDPWGNIIFYDEIYRTTTNVQSLAEEALPKMIDEERQPLVFRARVIDYANKLAAEDLRRHGLLFTNAIKQDKLVSVNRFMSYLHPNPKHHFPEWHPRAGHANAPRCFMTSNCRNLLRELPQQRWKADVANDRQRDEMDRTIPNHAVDCALYITRELPDPTKLPAMRWEAATKNVSKASELYWADVARQKELQENIASRNPYRPFRGERKLKVWQS